MNTAKTAKTAQTAQTEPLLDHLEIVELVSRLGVALDDGRFDTMATLLADDVTATTPGGTAAGIDAVVAQARRNHRPDQNVQHVITNPLIDLAPEHDRATVRANAVVHFATAPGAGQPLAPPVEYMLGGVYRFGVVRTDRGWRFSRIETNPVWMAGTRPI